MTCKHIYECNVDITLADFKKMCVSGDSCLPLCGGRGRYPREWVNRYPDMVPAVELRVIPEDEARELILKHIDENKEADTSDFIFDLELDPELVVSVLEKLYKEGAIVKLDHEVKEEP